MWWKIELLKKKAKQFTFEKGLSSAKSLLEVKCDICDYALVKRMACIHRVCLFGAHLSHMSKEICYFNPHSPVKFPRVSGGLVLLKYCF